MLQPIFNTEWIYENTQNHYFDNDIIVKVMIYHDKLQTNCFAAWILGKGGIGPLVVEWGHADVFHIAPNVDHLKPYSGNWNKVSDSLFFHIQKMSKNNLHTLALLSKSGGSMEMGWWVLMNRGEGKLSTYCHLFTIIIKWSLSNKDSWCYLHAVGQKLWLVLKILLQRIYIDIPEVFIELRFLNIEIPDKELFDSQ